MAVPLQRRLGKLVDVMWLVWVWTRAEGPEPALPATKALSRGLGVRGS